MNLTKLTPFDESKQALEGSIHFRENANYSWSWLIEHTKQQNALITELNGFETELRSTFNQQVEDITNQYNGYKDRLNSSFENFKSEVNNNQQTYQSGLSSDFVAYKEEINNNQQNYENTLNAKFDDYKSEFQQTHNDKIGELANEVKNQAINQLSETGIIPRGLISLWSGTIEAIPQGWALCNGENGTPDLRDRFVVGAGLSYALASKGGSKDAVVVEHTHTQSSHSHSGTTDRDGGHSHSVYINSAGGHSHSVTVPTATKNSYHSRPLQGYFLGEDVSYTTNYESSHSHSGSTDSEGDHAHILYVSSATPTIHSTGVSGVDKNLPPYYALAYIMKI